MERETWRRLFGPLASDWLSIREASMIYDKIEGQETKGYKLNRGVQLLFRGLKNNQLLEEKVVEKRKQSTSKKGNPRSYTSKCLRYRLDLVKLIEKLIPFSDGEIKTLKGILADPAIDTILRRGNRSLENFLTKLVFVFIVFKKLQPIYRDTGIPEFTIPEVPLPEVFAQFTEKEIEDFQLVIQRIARGETSVVNLADKILESSIPITFTSKEYYRLVTGGIVQPFADAVTDIYKELIFRFPRLKPVIQRIVIRHFAKIKK